MSDEPDETSYYLRLLSMYMDLGTETVLDVFTYHSPWKQPETFIRSKEETLLQLKQRRILNKQESKLLFTDEADENVQHVKNVIYIKEFDISLLITLSINLFDEHQLQPPAKGWLIPPRNNDTSIAADLLRLRTKRNVLVGHYPKARMEKWRFDQEWTEISEILIRIHLKMSVNSEKSMKERIDAYRVQKLYSAFEGKHDTKLKEWLENISSIQDLTEKLCKDLKDFQTYFKDRCDRYERYIALLIKGGRFVLSAFLDRELKKRNKDLRSVLKDHTSKESVELLGYMMSDFNKLCLNEECEKNIPSTWDVSNIAMFIDVKFGYSIERVIRRAIKGIADAYRSYADAAVVALDGRKFEQLSSDLKTKISIVANFLDEELEVRCLEIITECTESKVEESFKFYMDILETQNSRMKSISDIFQETLQKTKECLQDMVEHGIDFKNKHVLDLKIITIGEDAEKIELAEEILKEIWQTALMRSQSKAQIDEGSGDIAKTFPLVADEVRKILGEVKSEKAVQKLSVEKKCIILHVTCGTPHAMLEVIHYFESSEFHDRLSVIAKELGYHFNTTFAFNTVMQIDNLWGICNQMSTSAQSKEFGIRLPISVSSPAEMIQVTSIIRSDELVNSANVIADSLSSHLQRNLTVKIEADTKELQDVFDTESRKLNENEELGNNESCSPGYDKEEDLFNYQGNSEETSYQAAAAETITITKADKYYRLVSFLVNISPRPLTELLLKYIRAEPTRASPCSSVNAYLYSQKAQLLILRKKNVLREEQWELLFPSTRDQVAGKPSWDTTLVTLLLGEFFGDQLQQVEKDAIQKIRDIRNRLQHITETSIDNADFDNMWTILESATIDLALQIQPSPSYANTIQHYIDDIKTNIMPKLGDTLRYFYESIIKKLKTDMDDMKEILKEISENTSNSIIRIEECQNRPLETDGSAGAKVKRMKTKDQILVRLNDYFTTTVKDNLPKSYDMQPPEVSEIKSKLRDSHHVVVTGDNRCQYLQAALAAVQSMNYNPNRCVELRNACDWRHIDPDEVDLVLCLEPFGDCSFDEEKTKGMADIFNYMLQTAKNYERDRCFDILIVAEVEILQQVLNYRKHEILGEVVKLYQPTSEFEPVDLTGSCENYLDFDQATRNQLEFSAALLKRYTGTNLHPTKFVEEAKATLKKSKLLVLTGPRKCGKTTLALMLASKYQKNQFLVVNKPDDMKLIKIGSICTVLVEDFAGKYHYDDVQAQAWLKEFELLYSAVCSGKLNVIITCEQRFLFRCKTENGSHPILQNKVFLKPISLVKKEIIKVCDTIDTVIHGERRCSANMEKLNNQNTPSFTRVKTIQVHGIVLPENTHILHGSQSFCQHPDGSFLVLVFIENRSTSASPSNPDYELVVQHINSDFEHNCFYDINTSYEVNSYDICCTDTGGVVIAVDETLGLYKISRGTLQLLEFAEMEYCIKSVSFQGNWIFCSSDDTEILILDTNLSIKSVKCPFYDFYDDYNYEEVIVPCSLQSYFSTYRDRNLRNFIICEDMKLEQVKCLREKDFDPECICAATEDSVFVLGEQGEHSRIIQVNSNMTVLLDMLTEEGIEVCRRSSKMVYDRDMGRLVIYKNRIGKKHTFIAIDLE